MSKKILTFALAALTAGSAFAFGPKRVLPNDSRFGYAPYKAEARQGIPTRADGRSLDYTLADEPYNSLSLNNLEVGDTVYQAFEFTPAAATNFSGDKITSFNLYTGCTNIGSSTEYGPNGLEEITVFITKSLEAQPVYTQKATLKPEAFTLNRITLDTPYDVVDGEGFYMGYYFEYTQDLAKAYYITVDGVAATEPGGCWVGVRYDGKLQWANYGDQVGNLNIGCTVEGENMPVNGVQLVDIAGPLYCMPGKAFEYNFLVKGMGLSTSSVEISYTAGDGEAKTATFQVEDPLTYNQYAIFAVDDIVCNTEGLEVPLKFEVTKVNGVANTCPDNSYTSTINCFAADKGFPRVHLIEEGTGTWCGFCPLGIVMMEYVAEKYPDFFARVAIHANADGTSEPMYQASTQSWLTRYAQGFPCGMIDRSTDIEALSYANYTMLITEMDTYVKRNQDVPALIGFSDIECSIDEKGKMSVETKVKSAFDMPNNNRYRLGYYLTQDSVGPYRQANYYAGNAYGPCDGWESKGRSVATEYNEVCRLLHGGASGFNKSLPDEFKAGEEYSYSTAMNVLNVTGPAFKLIAFIFDAESGEIANAKVVELENTYYLSGIDGVTAADAEVVARKFYNLNGMEVSEPAEGLYIVRTTYSDGTVKAAKVMVK